MGRYCSYLLPKQAEGTPQIIIFQTLRMTGHQAVECPKNLTSHEFHAIIRKYLIFVDLTKGMQPFATDCAKSSSVCIALLYQCPRFASGRGTYQEPEALHCRKHFGSSRNLLALAAFVNSYVTMGESPFILPLSESSFGHNGPSQPQPPRTPGLVHHSFLNQPHFHKSPVCGDSLQSQSRRPATSFFCLPSHSSPQLRAQILSRAWSPEVSPIRKDV